MSTKKGQTDDNGAQESRAPLVVGRQAITPILPTDIEQVYRLGTVIAKAGWAPKSYLIDPKNANNGYDQNKICMGIMHGMEIGLTPVAALQSIAVINGFPSVWGDGAMALVYASGLLENAKEWLGGEGDTLTAHCEIKRKGRKEKIHQTFSMADAKKASLSGKAGPWTLYPQRMLQMRARSWALRDGFADVLRGLTIAEEAMDMVDLTQQADGSFAAPAGQAAERPARGEAVAENTQGENEGEGENAGQEQAEHEYIFVDETGEVHACKRPGEFAGLVEKAIKAAQTTDALDLVMENNKDKITVLGREVEHVRRAWAAELHDVAAARKKTLATPPRAAEAAKKNGGGSPVIVELFDERGEALAGHTRMDAWFDGLGQVLGASTDPELALDKNRASAEAWAKVDSPFANARWREVAERVSQGRFGEDRGKQPGLEV